MYSGIALEPETITFRNRVLADGGEIVSLQYANNEVKRLKSLSNGSSTMWSRVHAYPCAEFAVKKDVSGNVEKIYCLKRALMDLVQTNASYKGVFTIAENGRASVSLDGINDFYQSGTDLAMVQPLTNWFNCYKSASEKAQGYYFDGMVSFDNCRVYGGFTAFAGASLAPPAVAITNTVRQRVIFNGASSSNFVKGNTSTGNVGTNPMNGITIGKPGGGYATGTVFNQIYKFHSLLVLGGVADASEITSTDTIYSSRYI